jgi:predicted MPP superfamily phosphohydrolase
MELNISPSHASSLQMTSRRKVICSILGIPLAGAYAFGIEPRWLDLARHTVRLPRLRRPVRLVHLSDLHASAAVSQQMIADAVALAISAHPDLICLTGDYISYRDVPEAAEYAQTLRSLAEAAPTFAVLGNHDGGGWSVHARGFPDHRYVERVLSLAGIELLQNRPARIEVHGQPLTLVGVGDCWAGDLEPDIAFAGVRHEEAPTVLLSHNPDTKDVMANYPWHLMLSGHTHGGQVIVPLYGPPIVPVNDRRYVSGLKPWGARQIHVTRGEGNIGGVRFACRPEPDSFRAIGPQHDRRDVSPDGPLAIPGI